MEGHTHSWVDIETHAALRFHKSERSPLGTSIEQVELFPAQSLWQAADGVEGTMPTQVPLDELSFLYHIRTLPLPDGAELILERHFDASRNPVLVRVVGRDRIRVPAGEFQVVVVEMRVPDSRVNEGGSIRIYLTDDARRTPVRIESSARVLGRVVFVLETCNRPHGATVWNP
jgi:hypothetical protein